MFFTSTPVTGEQFKNRRRELAWLEGHIDKLRRGVPSWVAIVGQRKTGKTSLLLEAARRLADPRLLHVVLDTFEESPVSPAIFRRYALRVLDGFFATELGVSLEALAPRPAEFRAALAGAPFFAKLPARIRALLLEVADAPVTSQTVRDYLQLPEALADALGVHVVVAWDEFQELSTLGPSEGLGDPLPVARSVWQKHRRVGYVISGSARTMLLELVSSEHSPFFQHFSVLELGPFEARDAAALLTDHGIPGAVAEKAAVVLGGNPFYIQLLGETLERMDGPIDGAALKEALSRLVFSRTGRLGLYFEGQFHDLVGRSTYLATVLQALAEGPRRLSEIAKAIGAPAGATVRYIERVGDAIRKDEDGRYALTDPTFGLWLSWRKPGGTVIPMKLVGDEAELATAQDLGRMGFDLVYQSRASHGAFDLLATRGSVPLGVQVKRRPLPLRFSAGEWNRMQAEAERFGWRHVVAQVSPASEVVYLDPARARRSGKERSLGEGAQIDNLLRWLDGSTPTTRRRK